MDLQGVVTVIEALHPDGVVEIPGCLAVDSDNVEVSKIATTGKFVDGDRTGDRAGLLEHLFGKTVRDVVGADQDLDIDAEIAGLPQDFRDPAERTFAVFAEVEDFGCDDHAVKVVN